MLFQLKMQTTANDESEIKDAAETFTKLYIDIVENHVTTISYYLSESATLDWFGKTIKGSKNISAFLKDNAIGVKHMLGDPKPVDKIGHRDTHVIKYPKEQKKRSLTLSDSPTAVATSQESTPPNEHAGSSNTLEQGQGDGLHNCDILTSPAKRCRLDDMILCAEPIYAPIKYVSMEGHVEFHKRSTKKFQRENKWQRPCKLEIAYSNTNVNDTTIHLIIYSCEMKCKRNLLTEFESSAK